MTRLLSASLLLCLATLGANHSCAAAPEDDQDPLAVLTDPFKADWRRFKHQYVMPDGRVIDTGNGDVSHSEGQGYAMLFAVAADDRETFETLRAWTERVLQRSDGLHHWRFDPRSEPMIEDPNAAADGELLIAWALLRAADRWQERTYLVQARVIIQAFESRLVRRIGRRLMIVPWDLADLESPRIINPSYFVFPAMQDIAVEMRSDLWLELYADCLSLVQEARFGRWQLPPDWLSIDADNRLGIWSERNPYFSYDAIRIPLHLAWAGHDTREFLGSFLETWARFPPQRAPDWFDLSPGGAHSRDSAPPGFSAVRSLTETIAALADGETTSSEPLPTLYVARDYYSASLIMLARLAEIDWWQARLKADPPRA
jgi:endoglucanase